MIHVCFVCLGNICRSPTAEAVFNHLVQRAGLTEHFHVDSAGTSAAHAGARADRRAQAAGAARGYSLRSRARQVQAEDLQTFDYMLAMDRQNLVDLQRLRTDLAPSTASGLELALLLDYDADQGPGRDVPDPYYGQQDGFATVLDLCEAACQGLLARIRSAHSL